MSNICKKSNFNLEGFSNSVDLLLGKYLNLEEAINNIKEGLRAAAFSSSLDESSDPDNFVDSVNLLIKSVCNLIRKQDKIKLNRKDSGLVSQEIKGEMLPIAAKTKEADSNIKVEEGKSTEELRKEKDYEDVLDLYFDGNPAVKEARREQLHQHLMEASIINMETGHEQVITDAVDLNENLKVFKSQQYKIVKDFLVGNGFDSSSYPRSLYIGNNVTHSYTNVLNDMYLFLQNKIQDSSLNSDLYLSWLNHMLRKGDESLYNALNSYINLAYFDETIDNATSSYININNSLVEPITKLSDGTLAYKYSFKTGNVNQVDGWNTNTVRDAIKEMGKFVNIIIESIPLISYDSKNSININLNAVRFCNAITHLRDTSDSSTDENLKKLVDNLHYDPENIFPQILKYIFLRDNKTILNDLTKYSLTNFDLNVLYSIYDRVYKGKHSYQEIENKFFRDKGFTTKRYPIVQSLLGVAVSTTGMNYLQVKYNYAKQLYETAVKKKFPSDKRVYDMITHVNLRVVDSIYKLDLLEKYPINNMQKDRASNNYEITIGNFKISVEPKASNTYGALYKNEKSDKVDIKLIVKGEDGKWFKTDLSRFYKMDLGNLNKRQNLIDGNFENELEKDFMNFIEFIDKTLLTTFSKDLSGLLLLKVFMSINNNSLESLAQAASRAIIITDIYNKFDQYKTKNNLSNLSFNKFLDENPEVYPACDINKLDRDRNIIVAKDILGDYLSTLSRSEQWLHDLSNAEAILSGEVSKSGIKNLAGDPIPNFSPAFEGSAIKRRTRQLHDSMESAGYLLFASNPEAIKLVVIDTDVQTIAGKSVHIKEMTKGDLLYHSIVDKFLVPLLHDSKHIIIQPTTYSDKTKFINYIVSQKIKDLDLSTATDELIEKLMVDTIGKAYQQVYKNVLADYLLIFDFYSEEGIKRLSEYKAPNGTIIYNSNILNAFKNNSTNISFFMDALSDVDKDFILQKINKELSKIVTDTKNENIIREAKGEEKIKLSEAETILSKKAFNKGITVYRDLHYRFIKNNVLTFNESLYNNANNTYFNVENLHKRLLQEKLNFVNSLIKNRVKFFLTLKDNGDLDKSYNDLTTVMVNRLGGSTNLWRVGKKMIIAKVKGPSGTRNILYGNNLTIGLDEELILNPILNNYFMVHSLVSNNLRFTLTGSELNHKVKYLNKLNLAKTNFNLYAPFLVEYGVPDLNNASLLDIKFALDAAKNDSNIINLQISEKEFIGDIESIISKEEVLKNQEIVNNHFNTISKIEKLLNSELYKLESLAQSALLKRNVIVPATLRYYALNTLNGIYKDMKVAIIDDILANLFNFDGLSGTEDAHDGLALVDPFSSRLENLSLQDNEVGTVKKPIWHHYSNRYMDASLVKYAADTITNQWMRQSELSTVSLKHLFKKMTNIQWNPGEIDLIDGCEYRIDDRGNIDSHINFNSHILEGKQLYYKKGSKHYQIKDFRRDAEGNYYTIEKEVIASGEPNITPELKVYHFFDANGNHYTSNKEGLHTINSLYELHTALGGIYSESLTHDNGLLYSEASVYAVVNYMNNVATYKNEENSDRKDLTQKSYYQPLKEKLISYAINNSAIKNGAGNVNPARVYNSDNEEELMYITLSTEGHGVQMDADHESDEAQMTEFSQVISSLDAGGRMHNYVKLIYNALGRIAIMQSQLELDAIKEFRETKDLNEVYDIVGRTIINNLANKSGQAGLASAIIKNIRKKFDLNSDHALDKFKIPFSDSNIYSNILSTFASIINNKSIKRKFPGLGTVMVGGYNISLIWDINGTPYQFEDLVKLAVYSLTEEEKESLNSDDISEYNKNLVSFFLKNKVQPLETTRDLSEFKPTDIVDIVIGGEVVDTVNLDDIYDYRNFKDSTLNFIKSRIKKSKYPALLEKTLLDNFEAISFRKNVIKPRNLAPALITFSYKNDKGEVINTNIFDTWALKEAFAKKLGDRADKEVLKRVLIVLDGLHNKVLVPKEVAEDYLNRITETIDYSRCIPILNLKITEAEVISSNIYRTKYGFLSGDSLVDILNNKSKFLKPPVIINSNSYELAFTKNNGDNTYITFNKILKNSETFDSSSRRWKYIHREKFLGKEGSVTYKYDSESKDFKLSKAKVINKVFATDKNNIKLFEVGRDILRDDIKYNKVTKKFEDSEHKPVKNQSRFRRYGKDLVLEYIEFLHAYQVTETTNDVNKYKLYNIDYVALKQVLEFDPKDDIDVQVNFYISNMLGNLYKAEDYCGVQIPKELKRNSAIILEKTLKGFGNSVRYNKNLKNLIYDLHSLFKGVYAQKDGKQVWNDFIRPRGYVKILNTYLENLINDIMSSYLKAQEFIVARIPAQTLQSFMKMRNVGFTGTKTNQCFVSHWQTWLQGSDYDIDKAYMMGHNFNNNGIYIGWSSLFDYSSLETLTASEQLPMPSGKFYLISKTGYDLNDEAKEYESLEGVEKIKTLTSILTDLNELEISELNIDKNSKLYNDIIDHEKTNLPNDLRLDAYKNFISSHIGTVIQDVRNMIGAYSPIAMDILREGAQKESSKASNASSMTLVNPSVLYEMLYENMTGKNVIGIAANGEKASFMWHYWMNDMIRNNRKDFNKYALFHHTSSRIARKADGSYESVDINCLPDINLDNLSALEGLRKLAESSLPVDLMISLVLSAATDNAKELILATINAGNKMAKCYLYLITLGYNINDIIHFMTSPAVNFIDTYTENSIYGDVTLKMDEVCDLASGNLSEKILYKFMSRAAKNLFALKNKNWEDFLKNPGLEITHLDSRNKHYAEVENFIDFIEEVRLNRHFKKGDTILEIDPDDVILFKEVLDGANEFSSFGLLLGLNLGLPTDKISLNNRLQTIENIIKDREKVLGIIDDSGKVDVEKLKEYLDLDNIDFELDYFEPIVGKFDVRTFLRDETYIDKLGNKKSYRQLAIEYQNKLKINIPIFKIVTDIDLFRSIIDLLGVVEESESAISVKSKLYNQISNEMRNKKVFINDYMQKGITSFIDDLLVLDFFDLNSIKFTTYTGDKKLNSNWQVVDSVGKMELNEPANIATFKYLFENKLIPKLLLGYYWNENGEEIYDANLLENDFIKGLIKTVDKNVPLYKANLDMLAADKSISNKIKFLNYLKGLQNLSDIKIDGRSLSDWFMIYNLIVNKNNYGSDRLTTLLQSFIQDYDFKNNFIKEYLEYIGKVDYNLDISRFKYTLQDVLIATAKQVSSTYGHMEPILIVSSDSGPVFMLNVGYGKYEPMENLINRISGETDTEYLLRIVNRIQYGTLRINYQTYIDSIVKALNTVNEEAINIIKDLYKLGTINTITNKCE